MWRFGRRWYGSIVALLFFPSFVIVLYSLVSIPTSKGNVLEKCLDNVIKPIKIINKAITNNSNKKKLIINNIHTFQDMISNTH